MPTLGSLFSGIGGIDKGFQDAGWEVAYQVESDGFCNRVLQEHWPEVPRWGDIRTVRGSELPPVDCCAAGVPCQDVSVAGKRAGLNGERTGLFWEFVRILEETRPRWFLFENVPGLLSSNKGRDFWLVVHALCEVGYGLAWRVLDSRYFGVPQRRRRIYIVGRFGGPCPPQVLFESNRKLLSTLGQGMVSHSIMARGRTNNSNGAGNQVVLGTLKAAGVDTQSRVGYIACCESSDIDADGMREVAGIPGCLDACALDWPSDAPRYRALGNAVTVNVARWIAQRIGEEFGDDAVSEVQ